MKTTKETRRFWFRTSDRYMVGPFTMVGVLATSWEEATEIAMNEQASREILCIPPELHFLSCNVTQMQAQPTTPSDTCVHCIDPSTVLVHRFPVPTPKRPLARTSGHRSTSKRSAA